MTAQESPVLIERIVKIAVIVIVFEVSRTSTKEQYHSLESHSLHSCSFGGTRSPSTGDPFATGLVSESMLEHQEIVGHGVIFVAPKEIDRVAKADCSMSLIRPLLPDTGGKLIDCESEIGPLVVDSLGLLVGCLLLHLFSHSL